MSQSQSQSQSQSLADELDLGQGELKFNLDPVSTPSHTASGQTYNNESITSNSNRNSSGGGGSDSNRNSINNSGLTMKELDNLRESLNQQQERSSTHKRDSAYER